MYEKKYFVQSQISNYKDYREKKFTFLCKDLINSLALSPKMSILDFGCASGGLLLEFKKKGFQKVKGTDISYYMIDYGKRELGLEKELHYHNLNLLTGNYEIILFLDVLEHIPLWELNHLLKIIQGNKSDPLIVFRVPVAAKEGENFVLEVSRNDVSHIQCHAKAWWQEMFARHCFREVKRIYEETIFDSEGVYAAVFEKEGN